MTDIGYLTTSVFVSDHWITLFLRCPVLYNCLAVCKVFFCIEKKKGPVRCLHFQLLFGTLVLNDIASHSLQQKKKNTDQLSVQQTTHCKSIAQSVSFPQPPDSMVQYTNLVQPIWILLIIFCKHDGGIQASKMASLEKLVFWSSFWSLSMSEAQTKVSETFLVVVPIEF